MTLASTIYNNSRSIVSSEFCTNVLECNCTLIEKMTIIGENYELTGKEFICAEYCRMKFNITQNVTIELWPLNFKCVRIPRRDLCYPQHVKMLQPLLVQLK